MAPNPQDPHAGQPVLRAGSPVADARLVAIMIHGRGASAENILQLALEFHAADIAYLAPQAAGSTWYPYSFLSPIDQNEPGMSSGLRVIERLIDDVTRQGIQPERIVLMGFSQGGCLSLEFAARHPRQYAEASLARPERHATTLARSTGRRCFSVAVTWTRTSRWSVFTRPPPFFVEWVPASTSASTRVWATPSRTMSSRPWMPCCRRETRALG